MGNRFIYSLTIILLVHLMFCPYSQGQDIKIKYEECPDLAKKFNFDVPEGKALFVFEGKENYNFSSDNENIEQPQKVGSIYKLLISADPPSGGITVFTDDASSLRINYGREMGVENSLPPINSKDIKYFKLSIRKNLGYENVTQKKKAEGYLDQASKGDKDNLIILFPTPKNLNLQFSGDTTHIRKDDDGSYRVYIKPDAKKLYLISKGFDKTTIELGDSIGTKNTLYFDIRGSVVDEVSIDANINTGDYLLTTDPPGALIELKGNPSFNEQKNRTPYTFKDYKAEQELVHLTLDRYEPNDAIILIGGKRNNKNVTLEPKFAFLNAIVEPAMPISKVLLDGKELIGIECGKDFECLKGTHNIEISAPHYYPETRQISLEAGKTVALNIKLRPKMGSLSILSGINASGAEVLINGKKGGSIPISNHALQEGNYNVTIKKQGYLDATQIAEVKEGQEQELRFNMQTFQGSMMQKVQQYKTAKTLFGMATLGAVATGAYFRYSAMMLSDEYKTATTDATNVYDKFEQHDLYSYIAFGAAVPLGVLTIAKMTQQRKAQRKMNLAVLPSADGSMFYLSWNF